MFGFRFSFHNGFSRKRIFSTKFIDKVRFGFQFSRKIFSNNLFRKSRREAFSVSSENMLPTTCRRFTKLRIFNTFVNKYRQNLVSKSTNSDKSQTPQFRETAVGGCTSFPPLNFNFNEVKRFLIAVAIILLAVAIFLLVD